MKKMCYVVYIGYIVENDEGIEEDYHVENEYYDTYSEALKAAERHHKGKIEGEYSDGAIVICDGVEIDEEPQEIEFF